jgi:hypothetical protein
MGSPFSHCAVLGAECLSSLYPRPLNGNLKILAESGPLAHSGFPRRGQTVATARVLHSARSILADD